MSDLSVLFSFSFVRCAFIVGLLISICFSLVSSVLVLRNCSLLGHGLSDIGFAAFSFSCAVGASPFFVSIPTMTLVSFCIICFGQSKKFDGSSLVAVFSTAALALGIAISSLNNGMNSSVYSFMFGSVFSATWQDVIIVAVLTFFVVSTFVLLYNRLFLVLVDESFAVTRGFNVNFYKFLISSIIAVVTVLGIKIVGTLLVSSLIVFPAFIAKMFSRSYKQMLVSSFAVSVLGFVFGMLFSLVFSIPLGASVVFVYLLFLAVLKLCRISRFAVQSHARNV